MLLPSIVTITVDDSSLQMTSSMLNVKSQGVSQNLLPEIV